MNLYRGKMRNSSLFSILYNKNYIYEKGDKTNIEARKKNKKE